MKFQISNPGLRSLRLPTGEGDVFLIQNSKLKIQNSQGFSLVEVLVVISLLAFIVLALMQVFSSTQQAFRASVTQTDVLEGGRATVELITSDLRLMTPSAGASNFLTAPVNFFALDNNYFSLPSLAYTPLSQNLPGGTLPRINVLNYFFLLGRENTKWIGIGYVVASTNTSPLYPLYRFYQTMDISASPLGLFNNFLNDINTGQWTNMSHVIDGVVNLVVRPYDINGYQMTNTYQFHAGQWTTNRNVWFSSPVSGEVGFYFFSNTIPATVELQMGILEDRALARAESLGNPIQLPWQNVKQRDYLMNQSGKVHVFRQRVTIQNVDRSAYQ